MAKKKIFFFIFSFSFLLVKSQTPSLKQWDHRYGGTGAEVLTDIFQDSARNIVLFGISSSDSTGNKSQHNWDPNLLSLDYWVIKTDSLGNKIWDKRYGGNSDETLGRVLFFHDHYILAGSSSSGISGDKTEPSRGQSDFWIVKTDTAGNKIWDHRYGGNKQEGILSIVQTNDNGFLAGGYSNSGINGDKTQNNWDVTLSSTDYWIVKLDSNGNKLWDKRFGGIGTDQLSEIIKDGNGFLLCGWAISGIGGDITQPNWDPFNNTADYWVVKIDASGNKLWEKRFGGDSQDILYHGIKVNDGFILAGYSTSYISGDKTSFHDTVPFPLGCDYWFVKIDFSGNKIWDKVIGGNLCENDMGTFKIDVDGNILIGGTSYSAASWEKSENNLGEEQTWVLKTDSSLTKIWDKTALTTAHDEQGLVLDWGNGCYVFANYTYAGIGGDKSEDNWDTTNTYGDYWMIKYCDTTTDINLNSMTGTEFNLFPNPVKELLNINWKLPREKNLVIKIYDVFGRKYFEAKLNTPNIQHAFKIDTSNLENGVYIVEILEGKKEWNKKFIINH